MDTLRGADLIQSEAVLNVAVSLLTRITTVLVEYIVEQYPWPLNACQFVRNFRFSWDTTFDNLSELVCLTQI